MSIRRLFLFSLVAVAFLLATGILTKSNPDPDGELVVGRNVNMVSGQKLPIGDPYLQRQNESSFAVSTRNPLHLLAGANDYRTVDMPESEGPLPGIPEEATAGDAWVGVFKSFNGGESWISTLLPGYPGDTSDEALDSPVHIYSTACDPTVRAGSNGLFYYSGIAFDRVEGGTGILFVARFIDNNFTQIGDPDPIKYLDAIEVDEGTPGQFADKPWIAVDKPRYGAETIPIYAPDTAVQNVARHNVYIVYSIFLGSLAGGDQSKILFARSTDCGTTWERPIKISEGHHRNQGTTIAISPGDGTIYLAWRRFVSPGQSDAIMVCKSEDFGSTFTKPIEINPIFPFDQITDAYMFRTYAFPTIAVDDAGIVYVAWADRGHTPPDTDARIVIKASADGIDWSNPTIPIEDYEGRGHQFMPSLAYAAGKLMMTWYDSRNSEGNTSEDCGYEISDFDTPSGNRHTIDVRIAQALPALEPSFSESTQVSKYLHWVKTNQDGTIADPVVIEQKEWNFPNYPLFAEGTRPFIGDYIDITAAPMFLYDVPDLNNQIGTWRFNTEELDPATFHVTWTDNRDVHPPADGYWNKYNPPTVAGSTTPCKDGTRTGMRNQNIYTSAITQGFMVGAPVNTKPLQAPSSNLQGNTESNEQKRTFLVFVKNLTDAPKYFRLKIQTPDDMQASFWEFGTPVEGQCELAYCGDKEVKLWIEPYSSTTLTVFVEPYPSNPYATFRVKVEELEGKNAVFQDYIILNPDPVNTQIVPVLNEYHAPTVLIESLALVNLTDPTALSEGIVYLPNYDYILDYVNPDIVTPAYRAPAYRAGNIVNPAYRASAVGDIPEGQVTDLQWRITNNNDTTSAYSFLPIGDSAPLLEEGVEWQLLIYRVNTTPASFDDPAPDDCVLIEQEHHELLYRYDSPAYRAPAYRAPAYRAPAYRANTLSLAPGESAVCTLRFIAPTSNPFDAEDYATTVAAAAVPQAANPDGIIDFASSLYIIAKDLPVAWVNDPYFDPCPDPENYPCQEPPCDVFLEAYGGTYYEIDTGEDPEDPDDDIWKYRKWKLKEGETLPSGLYLDTYGKIYGTPQFDSTGSYPKEYFVTIELEDESTPPQIARRKLKITINCEYHTITPFAGPGGSITPSDPVSVPHGLDKTFTIKPDDCFHVEDVIVDKDASPIYPGPVTTYPFTDVRADHTIDAIFDRDTFKITASAGVGGSITPNGEQIVNCDDRIEFTISVDEGYMLEDVVLEKGTPREIHLGPVMTYEFKFVRADHTIEAVFKELQDWVERYNNKPVNGNDEAIDIAVGPSDNVYVTGYSLSRNKGKDFYTISYDSEGVKGLSARYDGPAHMGDTGNAIAVDASGNVSVTGESFRGMKYEHSDYCTIQYNSSGELVWDMRYDARRNGHDVATAIALDSDGNAYITGRSQCSLSKSSDVLHYDSFTIKYNADSGSTAWEGRYDNTSVENAWDEGVALAVDSSRNVYVTGKSQGNGTGFDIVTIKYDIEGNESNVVRYDNNELADGNDEAAAIALDSEENIYVTGFSSNGANNDIIIIKYLPDLTIDTTWGNNGVVRFNSEYNNNDEAAAIAVDTAGNVYVTGYSSNGTNNDYVTIMYDNSEKELWAVRYDNNGDDEAADIAIDKAGNIYVTGRSQGGGDFDYYTIKYDSSGNMVWRVRYDNTFGNDEARALVVDSLGNVYVTGRSMGDGTGFDYATVKYEQ